MTAQAGTSQTLWRQLALWAARVGFEKKFAVVLTVAAVVAGVATYASLTHNPPFEADATTIYLLLNLNLVILLMLGAIIARRIVGIWVARRRGSAASRLHIRLVAFFSVLAVAPAILVAAFSALFFHVGVQAWFSERVSTAVNESVSVARLYLEEHQQNLRFAALDMATDINRAAPRLVSNIAVFNQFVKDVAFLRKVTEAMVIDGRNNVIARSPLALAPLFEPIPEDTLERARNERVVLLDTGSEERVRALVRLDAFPDSFLLIGRLVEPTVMEHIQRAQTAVAEYRDIEGRRSALQITFTLIYIVVAVLLLMAAVWLGLAFADTLVAPLRALITAADRVRAGDLTTRVQGINTTDELGSLARAFNRMTNQLDSQRRELIEANRMLDQRRQFTETVLSGVSAGVLGLDQRGRINLPNKSATDLLGRSLDELVGRSLAEAVPEMADLVVRARASRTGRPIETQVKIRRGADMLTLLVRIAVERLDGSVRGYVVTFDDVTELLSAQRKAAWADVARRIAHEIKNPLTPIQLSAERLKRRYLKQITDDPVTFVTCTDTIIRQVGDIGRMVDEFSAFARMPSPVIKPIDITEICRQALFLQRQAHPDILFTLREPAERPTVPCDSRQLSQAVTNLLQNALDAIEGRVADDPDGPPGAVTTSLAFTDTEAVITIEDNGKGLPEGNRERLTEPYVTTRAKGTGLGLAIVKKIMEDHAGWLFLDDRPGGGARVRMVFPRERPVETGGGEHGGSDAPVLVRRGIGG
jgi:two-component system nitrogen regulation sensor histidine kinase NtrY